MLSFTPDHARPFARSAPFSAPRASATPGRQLNRGRALTSSIVCLIGLFLSGCGPREQRYPLRGQIIEMTPDRTQVTVNHEDIPGFMPAMTMAYYVSDPKELQGLTPGDTITATLVVKMNSPTLTAIARTGHAPLPEGAAKPRAMDVLQPGDVVPDVPLTDQSGKTVRLSDWRGRVLAVTFVYTRCPLPDFCPRMDRNFAGVRRTLDADPALADRVHLVSVSFDPEHDTPAVLRAHANAIGADPRGWSYVTGTPDAIATLASRFGVSVIRETDPAAPITHNLRTAVVDGAGRFVSVRSGNDWTPDALLQDIRSAGAQR
jgi:protein SCO1/2